ncbi:MAG: hypothetical protein RR623_09560 [Bacilli bacterium]
MEWLKWENENECDCVEIDHPDYGVVITFYRKDVPMYDSYSRPYVDDDGDVCCIKYEHDEREWDDCIHSIDENYKENKKYYLGRQKAIILDIKMI